MSNLQAKLSLGLNMGATMSASNSRTGRLVTCGENYGRVQDWANMPSRDDVLAHPSCALLANDLLSVKPIENPAIRAYRGRALDQTGPHPTSLDMGPPKPHQTDDNGRYNRRGCPALYLCDSEYGVQREFLGEASLFVQEYEIAIQDIRIADLRSLTPDSFICGVLWYAEMAGRDGYPSRIFSQTIADIVGQHFDGMAIPGVRGEQDQTYSNIVMLRQVDRWPTWLRKGIDPYQINSRLENV